MQLSSDVTVAPMPRLFTGAKAIAAVLGRSERSVFHLLERGQLAGVAKVGGRWVLNLDVHLAETFGRAAA